MPQITVVRGNASSYFFFLQGHRYELRPHQPYFGKEESRLTTYNILLDGSVPEAGHRSNRRVSTFLFILFEQLIVAVVAYAMHIKKKACFKELRAEVTYTLQSTLPTVQNPTYNCERA